MKEALGGIILGAPLFFWGLSQFRKSRAAASWPAVPGWILQSTVSSELSRGDQDNPDSWTHYPSVLYQYQLGPQVYQGNQISIVKRGYQHPHQAQAVIAAFPAGTPRNVYYNPARPQESILEAGKTEGVLLMCIGGLILALALAAAFK